VFKISGRIRNETRNVNTLPKKETADRSECDERYGLTKLASNRIPAPQRRATAFEMKPRMNADPHRWDRMRETLERRFALAKQLIDASRPDDAAAIGIYLRSSALIRGFFLDQVPYALTRPAAAAICGITRAWLGPTSNRSASA
jgi:hypothetical protein